MAANPASSRLPRFLYWASYTAAAALLALVFLAPGINNGAERSTGPRAVLALAARDALLRRTALASALGLAVTASVFFRRPGRPRPPKWRRPQGPPSSANAVGA